jgi:hypothetical protein
MIKTIAEFENDVQNFFKKFEKDFKDNPNFLKAYHGYQVFFSPLKTGAKIWIIGINPGSGYAYSNDGKFAKKVKPLKNSEYLTHDYKVANSFRKLFEEDLEDLELLKNETVISNLHFICTPNQAWLNSLLAKSNLGDDFYEEYWGKVNEWNQFLWKYINPKLILSFGKAPVIDFFENLYDVKQFNTTNKVFTESPHCCYVTKSRTSSPIIQIKRTQSSIVNSPKLAEMIKFILAGK